MLNPRNYERPPRLQVFASKNKKTALDMWEGPLDKNEMQLMLEELDTDHSGILVRSEVSQIVQLTGLTELKRRAVLGHKVTASTSTAGLWTHQALHLLKQSSSLCVYLIEFCQACGTC